MSVSDRVKASVAKRRPKAAAPPRAKKPRSAAARLPSGETGRDADRVRAVAAKLMAKPRGSLTIDDLYTIPEGPPYYELHDGELVLMSPPYIQHQTILMNLAVPVQLHVRSEKLGRAWVSPVDIVIDDKNAYEPDLLFVAEHRLSIVKKKRIEGAPDLAVEILSSTTQRKDRVTKRAGHARKGTKHLWFVDSRDVLVEEWILDHSTGDYRQGAILGSLDETFEPKVFPGLKLPLAEIYRDVDLDEE